MFGKHLFRNTFAVLCIVTKYIFHFQSCLYRDVVFFFQKKGLNGCVHLRVIENSSLSSSSFGELVVACHVDWSRYNLYCIVARLEEFFWCKIFSLKKRRWSADIYGNTSLVFFCNIAIWVVRLYLGLEFFKPFYFC